MKKQRKGKRKLKDYKEYNNKIKSNNDNQEYSNEKNEKKNNNDKINKKNKVQKKMQNEFIMEAVKASDFISNIINQEEKNIEKNNEIKKNEKFDSNHNSNSPSITEEKTEDEKNKINNNDNDNDNDNDNNKKKKIDKFFLSSLYDLFEEYDEIIIKRDKNQQYIINACIKIDEEKEIRFEIIYDNQREYFDYYPNNKNFDFENEDEPFNYDLDIPKEDFCLLIRNFKKFKKK